jgi:hypothetical protein
MKATVFSLNNIEYKYFGENKIYEYMLINRFYHEAYVLLNGLLIEYKNNKKSHELIYKFFEFSACLNK